MHNTYPGQPLQPLLRPPARGPVRHAPAARPQIPQHTVSCGEVREVTGECRQQNGGLKRAEVPCSGSGLLAAAPRHPVGGERGNAMFHVMRDHQSTPAESTPATNVRWRRWCGPWRGQGGFDGRGQPTASPMLTAIMSGGVGISGRELYKYRSIVFT